MPRDSDWREGRGEEGREGGREGRRKEWREGESEEGREVGREVGRGGGEGGMRKSGPFTYMWMYIISLSQN